jgi:hypothetical protein
LQSGRRGLTLCSDEIRPRPARGECGRRRNCEGAVSGRACGVRHDASATRSRRIT